MQLMNQDHQLSDKISSSVKKSHKISIYSKRNQNTRSPKKHQPPSVVSRIQEPRDFQTVFINNTNGDKMNDVNGFGNKLNQQNFTQAQSNRSPLLNSQQKVQAKPIAKKQQSFQQPTYESNFFDSTIPVNKKAQTFQENQFGATINFNKTNSTNNMNSINFPSQQVFSRQNIQNISQMIDKQAESQLSNLSVLQGSFMTGVRNNNPKPAKESQNSNSSPNQQDMMQNFMKFMHEQIYIAKEKCEKKMNDVLRDNAKMISELKDKVAKNQILLKEKNILIDRMREMIKKSGMVGNNKKIHSEGQILVKKQLTPQDSLKLHHGNHHSYYQRRITDLQAKLRVLQSYIAPHTQSINTKIQTLQKGILTHCYSKLAILTNSLQSFIYSNTQKLSCFSQSHEKLRISLQKIRQQMQKSGFNQNYIKQQQQRISSIEKQLNDFMDKEFKYENYTVNELKEQMTEFKQQLRKMEGMHFENSKMIKLLTEEINNSNDARQTPLQQQTPRLTSLSNVNQTASKYTLTNPNMSKISISELSNTHEYSHIIEKLSPNQKPILSGRIHSHNQSHSNNNSESLISMSFTEEASESLIPQLKGVDFVRYHEQKQQQYEQSVIAMSKYTKTTDLKQTCSQLQNTPPSASKYYLPTTKGSISIHSIMTPHQTSSSTQQKIRNLNDLKMETVPLLQSNNKTPHKSILFQNKQSIDNNSSYLSIGQMEDFNLSRRDVNNETSDFSDDEFFYPGYVKEQVKQWESPEKSFKTSERFLEAEDFSPMKKKLISTEQNFYNSTKSPQPTTLQQSRDKPSFMYNSSFDYEKFSDDEDEDQREIKQNNRANFNTKKYPFPTYKIPPPSPQPKQQPNFTQNEQKLLNSIKGLQKFEYPVKLVYNLKKLEGIVKMVETGHSLNGKAFSLDRKEVEKLQGMGYVQVKTYV